MGILPFSVVIITKNEAMYNEDKLVVKVGRVGPMLFNDLEQERVLSNYHFIHGNAIRSYIDEMIEKLEKSLENQKRKINNAIQDKLKLLIAPQPEDEDKTDAAKAPLHSRMPSVYTPEISQVYTAAAYNNYDYRKFHKIILRNKSK